MDLSAFLLNCGAHRNRIGRVPAGDKVPRIVHQTYATKNVPAPIARNIERMKAENPGWTFLLHDDADIEAFVRRCYPQLCPYFQRINPRYGAVKADIFRYLLLYREGGVYLDIKCGLRFPLDDVLPADGRYPLSYWENGPGEMFEGWGLHKGTPGSKGEFQQWFIVSPPGHPFLKATAENVLWNMDVYLPSLHGVSKLSVLRLSGPIAYTRSCLPLLAKHPHRILSSRDDLGFLYSIFYDRAGSNPHGHYGLFPKHYSEVGEPLLTLSSRRRALNALVGRSKMLIKRCLARRHSVLGGSQ